MNNTNKSSIFWKIISLLVETRFCQCLPDFCMLSIQEYNNCGYFSHMISIPFGSCLSIWFVWLSCIKSGTRICKICYLFIKIVFKSLLHTIFRSCGPNDIIILVFFVQEMSFQSTEITALLMCLYAYSVAKTGNLAIFLTLFKILVSMI